MTYLVLARKYRPRSFDTLIGQDHVVRALTHALTTQRLHHAWLFTGTRGVGKTTLSRILAKSLNCETGITPTPCGVCRACTEIDAGRFVDYLELDAASNRGVDEMTQLLEQAVYAPSAGRYKVYMIDEVHMLTGHAFNAMLKTLEEPPPHVKFILATTDPQKIPVTVLSRCLQFNLKQMPPESIVGHLQEVLGQEEIAAETPALRLIAQAAGGSMRDALSLTDQAIAYSAGNLTDDAVRGMLGTIDQRHLVRLLEALASQEASAVLDIANELSTRGLSYSGALADLAVLLSRVAIEQRVPGVTSDEDPVAGDIVRLATLLHPDRLQLFYSVAVHSRSELALAPDEYAGFVMACLRMLALAGEGEDGPMPTPPPAGRKPVGTPSASGADVPAAVSAPASVAAPVNAASAAPIAAEPSVAMPASADSSPPQSTSVAPVAPTVAVAAPAPAAAPNAATPKPVAAAPQSQAEPVQPPPWDVGGSRMDPGVPVGEVSVAATEPAPAEPPPEPIDATLRDPEPLAGVPTASAVGIDPAAQAVAAAKAAAAAAAARPLDDGPVPTPDAIAAKAEPMVAPAEAAPATKPAPAPASSSELESTPVSAPAPADVAPPEPVAIPSVAEVVATPAPPTAVPVTDDGPPSWVDEAIPDDEDGYTAPPGRSGSDDDLDMRFGQDDNAFMSSADDDDDFETLADASAMSEPVRGAATPASPPMAGRPIAPPVRRARKGAAPRLTDMTSANWPALAAVLPVTGLAAEVARQSEWSGVTGNTVTLRIAVKTLADSASRVRLQTVLCEHFGQAVLLDVILGATGDETAHAVEKSVRAAQQVEAEQAVANDPFVCALVADFGGRVVADSIRYVDAARAA
ncbi:DNA polymerase III subunit gamma/tau [Schauerella aestuarii]|uniref:DNA polymerase III subunit gamma/tau n=1 Tax=Schauerella aestuarii TaxID=2511204 RepID=UPI00136A4427|nr:DNA polymerase III subunit gamma/tau [Achromobacter aestuarii]MYZ45447.1 DNA polymerase III subunit gamma/tau [Achromobacter aestuarii]